MTRIERFDQAMKAHKWWEVEELPEGVQWRKLEHNGMYFAPDYVRHNVPLLYDGEPVELTTAQEEIATFYASMPLDGPQLGDKKTAPVFNRNFWEGFKKALGKGHAIKQFSKLDFTQIRAHLEKEKMIKKAATPAEREAKKVAEEKLVWKYGFGLVDGNLQRLGNFRTEPPGLFRGRGAHPLTGKIKERTLPAQITLNIGTNAPAPRYG